MSSMNSAMLLGVVLSVCLGADGVEKSVVRVTCVRRVPDRYKPWTEDAVETVVGAGVMLRDGTVLTCAHNVSHAKDLYLQASGDSKRIGARVVAYEPGVDLAILKPESSVPGLVPVSKSAHELRRGTPIAAYGFPIGGDEISVTQGVVSRIEHAPYFFRTRALRVQVDAALNDGNSGGPIFTEGGNLAGIVFSAEPDAENIGYVIPVVVIDRFRERVRTGNRGVPRLREEFQQIQSAATRSFLGIPKDATGVFVRKANTPNSPLLVDDVLTHVGSHKVGNDGKTAAWGELRVDFQHVVPDLVRSGHVPVTILRRGVRQELNVPVTTGEGLLIPILDGKPSYVVVGPLVLTRATQGLVAGILRAGWWQILHERKSDLLRQRFDLRGTGGSDDLTVLCTSFPHKSLRGFDRLPDFAVLEAVNGKTVRSFTHAVSMIGGSAEPFLRLRFRDEKVDDLVFVAKDLKQITKSVLADNGVPAAMSGDLEPIWQRATTE